MGRLWAARPGDTATIASGTTVTVTSSVTVGSKTSAVGAAVTVSGASSSSYGTLVVHNGVTLTLRGYDTSTNVLMLINQYGTFAGGGVATDYKCSVGASGFGAGTSDNAPTTDYFGTGRPQNQGYDIGFFESIGSAAAPWRLAFDRSQSRRAVWAW